MTGQPTTTPKEIAGLMIRAKHWFPSMKPKIKALFLKGGFVRGHIWLISYTCMVYIFTYMTMVVFVFYDKFVGKNIQ